VLESKHSDRLARHTLTSRTFVAGPVTAGTWPAARPVFAPGLGREDAAARRPVATARQRQVRHCECRQQARAGDMPVGGNMESND